MTPRPAPCGWCVSVALAGDAVGLALEGLTDLLLGLLATHPVGALDGLAGLEVLVDLEEVLNLLRSCLQLDGRWNGAWWSASIRRGGY